MVVSVSHGEGRDSPMRRSLSYFGYLLVSFDPLSSRPTTSATIATSVYLLMHCFSQELEEIPLIESVKWERGR